MKKVLNASEAAAFLGCNVQKVRIRMQTGDWDIGNVVPEGKHGKQKKYDVFPGKLAELVGIDVSEVYEFFEKGEER